MLARTVERTTNHDGREVLRIRDAFGDLISQRAVEGDPADAAWLSDQHVVAGELHACATGCGTLCQTYICVPCYDRYCDARR